MLMGWGIDMRAKIKDFSQRNFALAIFVTTKNQQMQRIFLPLFIILYAFIAGCKSSAPAAPPVFCDTTCLKDTIKFQGEHKMKPYVYISASACHPDTLLWSIAGMGVNKKIGLTDFLNTKVYINKDYVRCYFKENEHAWLLFNDCSNGRGYSLKLPFAKDGTIGRKSSNINNLDPKFSLADNLVAYTDRGNIYVEDMSTGKTAMMTFGENLGIDYDAIHEYIDSVNVTNSRIWARVKKGKEWKEMEKSIMLQ
jgi:hypothetical protein